MQFHAKHPQLLFNEIGRDFFTQLLTACGTGEEDFRSRYLPMAERLALFVQELPLEREAFCQPGGALKFGLLAGLTALRLCDGVIFAPGATAQQRMLVEPQFRWAAWCATLACVPLVVAHNAQIKVQGLPWSYASSTPTLWDACNKNGTYEVDWMPQTPAKPSPELGIVLLSSFFFPGQFAEIEPSVLQGLCQAINPALSQSPAELSLSRVVRTAQEKVRLAERQRMSQVFVLASESPKVSDLLKSTLADSSAGAPPINTGLTTAPTASIGDPGQAGSTPSAMVADTASSSIPERILQWARAVASSPDRHSGLEFLSNGELRVSKQVLNFGATARETYKALFDANLVVRKGESDAVVKPELAAIFKAAMGAVNAQV